MSVRRSGYVNTSKSVSEGANNFVGILLYLQLRARHSIWNSASRWRSAFPILPPFRSCRYFPWYANKHNLLEDIHTTASPPWR